MASGRLERVRQDALRLLAHARATENNSEAVDCCIRASEAVMTVLTSTNLSKEEKAEGTSLFNLLTHYAETRKVEVSQPQSTDHEENRASEVTCTSKKTPGSPTIDLSKEPVPNPADLDASSATNGGIHDNSHSSTQDAPTASKMPESSPLTGPRTANSRGSAPTSPASSQLPADFSPQEEAHHSLVGSHDEPTTSMVTPSGRGSNTVSTGLVYPQMIEGLSHLSLWSTVDNPGVKYVKAPIANRIRVLPEPLSTRMPTTREKILVLKSGKINGCKFPPWSVPSPADFSAQDGLLDFSDSHDLGLSPQQLQFFDCWARPEQALPPPSMRATQKANSGPSMTAHYPIDLVQDAGTDCSVVASLCAAIARTTRGHEDLVSNKVWPQNEYNNTPIISSNGKYIVRLNFNGCWRAVVIDDKLPVSSTHRILHVLDRSNPALLWPALLEKAYLKIRGGYDFPGSNSCGDLWTLTGWIPEQVHLQEDSVVPDQLWKRIHRAFQYGDVLVTLGTGKMTSRNEREVGLEGQHSYVILDMKEDDGQKLFLIKNPWVESSREHEHESFSLHKDHDNGALVPHAPRSSTFWKSLEYVVRHFESLYLNWNPGLFSHRQDIHFEWKIRPETGEGGCLVDHPQFSLSCRTEGPVWLLLSHHFQDGPEMPTDAGEASGQGYLSIIVYDANGERVFLKDRCVESGPFVDTPQSLLQFHCQAHTDYTIIIDQDGFPPSDHTFSLSAFANSIIALGPATEKYGNCMLMPGKWTQESSGGDTTSARYFDNPQYSLEVTKTTSLGIMLTSRGHSHPLHINLVHGSGKRVFNLQKRDIIAASGEYRTGCAISQIDQLPAGFYTIICSLFEAGKLGDFTLKVFSSQSDVRLSPIPREGAGLFSMKLSIGRMSPQTRRLALPFYPSRLARFSFVARLINVTSAQAALPAIRPRSPLRLNIEFGTGPGKKVVRSSGDGQYLPATSVRIEEFHMDPQRLQSVLQKIYLVIDRLSGPGEAVEEWYEIEVFTDVPNAFETGEWRVWDDY